MRIWIHTTWIQNLAPTLSRLSWTSELKFWPQFPLLYNQVNNDASLRGFVKHEL